MKTTRRFRLARSSRGPFWELSVEGERVGANDFLGVEESMAPAGTILDLMIRRGVQRTTATAFLWGFLEERKKREEAGSSLRSWEMELECEA